MPKQYENDKKRLDRQKQAKDLSQNFNIGKKGELDSSPQSQTQKDGQQNIESNDKRIKKAITSTFLNVQQKLEKQTGFDCSLSGSTLVALYLKENKVYFGNAGDSRGIVIGESRPSHS